VGQKDRLDGDPKEEHLMDERVTTRAEFLEEVRRLAEELGEVVWEEVVEQGHTAEADRWLRERGAEMLRGVLGAAWTARSERLGVHGECGCGGALRFRQHQPWVVHTLLAGRDVAVEVQYGRCERCHRGRTPVLTEIGVDEKGFTAGLQELALLAGVLEPYAPGRDELLQRFAGVTVSVAKIERLVAQEGDRAQEFLRHEPAVSVGAAAAASAGPNYIGIDGGMIFVEGRWQEAKLACVYQARHRVEVSTTRAELLARQVVAVRGEPAALGALLWPRAKAAGIDEQGEVVVLGDGAPWIWNLAAEHFPRRVEILDWYHAKEHVSATARMLYGEGTERSTQWRTEQLDRLWDDRVDDVIAGLRFVGAHQRSTTKRQAVEDLQRYLTTHRARMRYRTFRDAGYQIGSGATESAIGHVIQQRMKRAGIRWGAAGADAMLALRSVYRSTGAWDAFWRARTA
jgi:hypothetical protein